jgi:serine/threonine-protein kinase
MGGALVPLGRGRSQLNCRVRDEVITDIRNGEAAPVTEDPEVVRRLGTTLRDKWTLKRVLGVGGMAAVYVGQHKIGREDAIKILHPEVARSKNVRARFEQEAHAVNRFRHPGVVEIRDIDVAEDGAPFLVMELLEGESLSARVKRAGMEAPELLRVVDDMLDVLAAAHAQGIIHRDIKPDNLFLMNDGRLKVLDFGIARMREGAPKTMHTKVGSTLGTVAYMAPEQTMSSKIDERADLFAVGATMFRILAKRYIHEAGSEMELLVKMASDPAPPLASVAPHVPGEICLIVDRALAFEKARRYPDARTMQADVRAVRSGLPPPHAAERLRVEGPPSPARAGGKAASAAVAATSSPGPSPDAFRDNPTVMPSGGGGAPAGSLAAGAGAAAMFGEAPTNLALSDERLGMTNTSFSVQTPSSFAPPPAVRVLAGNASLPNAAPSASRPPLASSPPVSGMPSGSVPPFVVSPVPSAPMSGRATNPSSPSYTPMLGRSPSRHPSPSDRVGAIKERAHAVKERARVIAAGAIAKIPEDKRRPALFGAIAFAVLLLGFFLWLGFSGSDDGSARDDATRDADADRSRSGDGSERSGDGSDPSATDGDQEAEPSPPPFRGKGKSKKRRKVYYIE